MSCAQILNALDVLAEYPEIQEYIKNFDSPAGFMFTTETQQRRKILEQRMYDLLDPNGMHSGSSFAYVVRGVQAILNGVWTRERLIQAAAGRS